MNKGQRIVEKEQESIKKYIAERKSRIHSYITNPELPEIEFENQKQTIKQRLRTELISRNSFRQVEIQDKDLCWQKKLTIDEKKNFLDSLANNYSRFKKITENFKENSKYFMPEIKRSIYSAKAKNFNQKTTQPNQEIEINKIKNGKFKPENTEPNQEIGIKRKSGHIISLNHESEQRFIINKTNYLGFALKNSEKNQDISVNRRDNKDLIIKKTEIDKEISINKIKNRQYISNNNEIDHEKENYCEERAKTCAVYKKGEDRFNAIFQNDNMIRREKSGRFQRAKISKKNAEKVRI